MIENVRFFTRLMLGLGWGSGRPGSMAIAGLVLIVLGGTAAVHDGNRSLAARTHHMSSLLDGVEDLYAEQVEPIERVLLGYRSDDPQLVRRVAVALVREARRTQLEPRLLLAVLLVENPWIDPGAASPVGAQGLMQVMPFHRGQWKPCEPRLDDIDANICHGARIFAWNLKASKGNMDKALLRYNGCVRGTNTPDCHQYPNHVYARAGRASVLGWRGGTMGASR